MKQIQLNTQAFEERNPGKPNPRGRDPVHIVQEIAQLIFSAHQGSTAIRLWDGTLVHGHRNASTTLVITEPEVVRELLFHPDLHRLVDAYLCGRLEVEGDFEQLFQMGEYLKHLKLSWPQRLRLLKRAFSLPSQSRQRNLSGWKPVYNHRNSHETIAHHYDLGNDFYRIWLDPEMVYSCAYFSSETQPLADAQCQKLDYLCRKLRLQPGQRLLDIGCGWGALAIWAAKHYGVRVHGITLSKEQHQYACQRVRDEGLEEQVLIEWQDYRSLGGEACYDRVVSVGMFEHIGIRNFPLYFGIVRRVLKPDGLFLNHGITNEHDWNTTPGTRFINHYIFPDGELARISTVIDAMENAGFDILDVENLRPHYTLTLRHWVSNLEAQKEAVVNVSSEITWRLWRLYMSACAFHFDQGGIAIHQVLAGQRGKPHPVPLRRDDLYR